jgi:hypothetical protein
MTTTQVSVAGVAELADGMVSWLESGELPEGLFAPDVFADISMPTWRIQSATLDEMLAIRRKGHPGSGSVVERRVDPTATGFVLEFAEHWHSGNECWYAREMIRCDVGDHGITAMSVYCTGDWDEARQAEHAEAVTLLRP